MKTKLPPLALGFLLGALALLLMGQSRPASFSTGRYQIVAGSGGGVYIADTNTGAVKFVSSLVTSSGGTWLGVPFESLP
jgi:hypothetical protein